MKDSSNISWMNSISIRCDDNLNNGDDDNDEDDDNVDEFILHNLKEFCCVFEIFLLYLAEKLSQDWLFITISILQILQN